MVCWKFKLYPFPQTKSIMNMKVLKQKHSFRENCAAISWIKEHMMRKGYTYAHVCISYVIMRSGNVY